MNGVYEQLEPLLPFLVSKSGHLLVYRVTMTPDETVRFISLDLYSPYGSLLTFVRDLEFLCTFEYQLFNGWEATHKYFYTTLKRCGFSKKSLKHFFANLYRINYIR